MRCLCGPDEPTLEHIAHDKRRAEDKQSSARLLRRTASPQPEAGGPCRAPSSRCCLCGLCLVRRGPRPTEADLEEAMGRLTWQTRIVSTGNRRTDQQHCKNGQDVVRLWYALKSWLCGRTTNDEGRGMGNGEWKMENGGWKMENGRRRIEFEKLDVG
jgi:hypothetical protein